ncbi:MAG: hypothetical protein ACE5ED_06360 [Rhodothalassiaceae bacterium]
MKPRPIRTLSILAIFCLWLSPAWGAEPAYDLLIRGGTVYDGSGAPGRTADHATYKDPHRYATGMIDVFVNGTAVLRDGEPTGALPGRVVRGPGWRGGTRMTP